MATHNISIHLDSMSSPAVKAALEQLAPLGITYLLYYVNFADGSELKCTNQPDWSTYFVESGLYQKSAFTLPPEHYEPGFCLIDITEHPEVVKARAEKFQIANVLGWINPIEKGCEMMFFGAKPQNISINNFYINHLDLLRRYIAYFKNTIAPEVTAKKSSRLLLPYRLGRISKYPSYTNIDQKTLKHFEKGIKIKQFNLSGEFEGVALSARELDCLRELASGKTSREMGDTLHISNRTVETHLAAIKQKLGLRKKSELIAFAQEELPI